MFKKYKVDIDSKKFFEGLNLVKKDIRKISKRMMGKVSTEIKKDSKKGLRGTILQKKEGNLLKAFKHKTKNDFSAVISVNSPYASTHEQGATILSKNKRYMIFKIDDEWKRVEKIEVPARPFLLPVIDSYFTTSKAELIMDKILQSALDEIFKE